MSNLTNQAYLLALHSINGLGPIRLKSLLDYFKDPRDAWFSSKSDLLKTGIYPKTADLLIQTRQVFDVDKYVDDIKANGISWVTIFDEAYPKLLKQIYDPPVVLYYKGDIKVLNTKSIGVVGTRKMTGYGRSVTKQFVEGLVKGGFTIVSGLAKGVDTEAHKTAIESDGKTVAVLGGGLKEIYPAENINLAKKITEGHGVIISEFAPAEPSMPGNFPARNRIISGLSMAVLVTEAAINSGSLITAKEALEQGRDVFAVPGAITSSLSKGPISLISEGARPVFDPSEILDELGVSVKTQIPDLNLTEQEKRLLEVLENESMHIDEICRSLDLSIAEVSSVILKMEITGLLRNLGGGIYGRV